MLFFFNVFFLLIKKYEVAWTLSRWADFWILLQNNFFFFLFFHTKSLKLIFTLYHINHFETKNLLHNLLPHTPQGLAG
jgi:hypothetical protein